MRIPFIGSTSIGATKRSMPYNRRMGASVSTPRLGVQSKAAIAYRRKMVPPPGRILGATNSFDRAPLQYTPHVMR